jgi:hypothetical protein
MYSNGTLKRRTAQGRITDKDGTLQNSRAEQQRSEEQSKIKFHETARIEQQKMYSV